MPAGAAAQKKRAPLPVNRLGRPSPCFSLSCLGRRLLGARARRNIRLAELRALLAGLAGSVPLVRQRTDDRLAAVDAGAAIDRMQALLGELDGIRAGRLRDLGSHRARQESG